MAAAVLVAVLLLPGLAYADQFDAQIAILKQRAQESQGAADQKAAQANDLQAKLASIDAQISAAQQQLNLTNAEISATQQRIKQANDDLAHQQSILKDNLRLIYREGQVTPLEVIASSKNLSDFVARQQYLGAIKKKVDDNLVKIDQLKKDLDTKQTQLSALSTQQKDTVNQIAAQRAQQQSLLAQTQGDEANYRKVVAQDNAQIADLRRQQAAVVASFSSNMHYGGTGGYPWAGAPFPNSISDPWGMYERQCVSYTAWRVANSGRNMPYWGGRGNAAQWPSSARSDGIPVDGSPRVGDVAISMAGPYGHAMYVEGVNGGSVHVSQYNADGNGNYSVSDVGIGGLQFIHF